MAQPAAAPGTQEGIQAPAEGVWEIDPGHSSVSFVARHLMISRVRGAFERFNGVITIGRVAEDSGVQATIEAASITTHDDKRDAHLRSPDFLDVERFPTLKFHSTKAERTGETSLVVAGELTIRDVTRPVTLQAEFAGATVDPWGNQRIGFTARAEIDREEFGITWNQALETGGVLVGKKVVIELEVAAVRAA